MSEFVIETPTIYTKRFGQVTALEDINVKFAKVNLLR